MRERSVRYWTPDLRAWEEALAFMKERAKLKVPQTGRTWTRDELYEEQ